MIRVFFLIFEPNVAWERIARSRRGLISVLCLHLLPMIFISSAAEGWGLNRWGKWQPRFQKFKEFSVADSVTFEAIQTLLLIAMVFVSALLLVAISQTFPGPRNYLRNYKRAFTTLAYGFSPLFLVRLMDAGPLVSPWTSWTIGISLSVWILYQGIPRVIRPDPTHALGMYLSAMFVTLLTSALARLLTAMYLLGEVDFHHSWFTHKFPHLFQ